MKIPARKTKKTKATKTKTKAKKTTKKATAKKKTSAKKATPKLAAVSQTQNRITKGDWAPEFTLPNQFGENVSLASLRGKKVVLYFYPKDDTPGCTKEACSFRDNLPTFEGADAVILGVSFDDASSHQKFIEKYGLNFQLLSDLNKETAQAYGVYVQKNMYGNISWGIERSTFVIDREGKIAEAFRRVNVDGHSEEVLNVLNQLG